MPPPSSKPADFLQQGHHISDSLGVGFSGFELMAELDEKEEVNKTGSGLGTLLQQANQHAALLILATKEHSKHLDVAMLCTWPKPINRAIESQMSKARHQVVVRFSAPRSGGQPFRGSNDRLDACLCVTISLDR